MARAEGFSPRVSSVPETPRSYSPSECLWAEWLLPPARASTDSDSTPLAPPGALALFAALTHLSASFLSFILHTLALDYSSYQPSKLAQPFRTARPRIADSRTSPLPLGHHPSLLASCHTAPPLLFALASPFSRLYTATALRGLTPLSLKGL